MKKQEPEILIKSLINVVSLDNSKTFKLDEVIVDGEYEYTGGLIEWLPGNGAGIFSFQGQGKHIAAKWLDSQILEITHEKAILFTKKDESVYLLGDEVKIKYLEK